MREQRIMKKDKKIMAVILTICIVLGMLPANRAYAIPDPKPESGSVFVNGVDLLNSDAEEYPDGISYSYDDNVNVITVSGSAITVGSLNGNKYSGIYINDVGDIEIKLIGNNTIEISNQSGPEPKEGTGIFVGGGSLTISGTGSLDITSEGRSIHLDSYGEEGKFVTFKGSVNVTTSNQLFTEIEPRPFVNIQESAIVTVNGIECGNDNNPFVDTETGASFTNTNMGGGDPGPGSGMISVNGVDLLTESAPAGVLYSFDEEGFRHIVTLNNVVINSGYVDGDRYSAINIKDAGDVEIILIGNNTIEISNQSGPGPKEGTGIFVGGGSLTISGTGSLDITSEGRSIHLDSYGKEDKFVTFKGSVNVTANNQLFTEIVPRPFVNIQESASVTVNGIECGNDNSPFVDTQSGASFTNTNMGGGDPGPGGDPGSGGEPGPGSGMISVNGVDLLTESAPAGVLYSFDEEGFRHIVTLNNAVINSGYVDGDRYSAINIKDAGDVEIILIGSNTIDISNQTGPEPKEGTGIFVGRGSLTISGTGSLDITSEGRSIHLDSYGEEGKLVTFKGSVNVTANNQLFTEIEPRPFVNIQESASVTVNGIECGNDNNPFVDTETGASFTNTNMGGGDPGPGGGEPGPFNLTVGSIDLVINDVIQSEDFTNLELVYNEHANLYSLYLSGGNYGGIYSEGSANIGIFVNESSTIGNLTMEDYNNYSIVMKNGGVISSYDFINDPSAPAIISASLSLTGGILAGNRLDINDKVALKIGSPESRADKGIVGYNNSLYVRGTNQSIHIWANSVGVEGVHRMYGFELGSSAELVINSSNIGAVETQFMVGEGASLDITYLEKGDFTPAIYKWDYMDMMGSIDTYANIPFSTIYDLVEGNNVENKYTLVETATSYKLISTAKQLYALGYNYDNDRDGVVDNPEEEIKNGTLSIKGATGVCWVSSDGFMDYHFEAGSVVTIELLPDYGYQYQAGTLGGNGVAIDTTPGETRAYYTFIMPDGNVHLYASFVQSSDIVLNNSSAITDATVNIGDNNIHGNVEFAISTDTASPSEVEAILSKADTKKIGVYLDLTLEEYIVKAGTEEAWTTELNELEEPVIINLDLSESMLGKTGYSVVRLHNGIATELATSYSNGSITFDTNQFSTYAIIYDEAITPTTPSPTPVTPTPIAPPLPTDMPVDFKLGEDTLSINVLPDNFAADDVSIQYNIQRTDETEINSIPNIILSSDVLNRAGEMQKDIVVTVRDKNNKELYTWTFNGEEAAQSDKKMQDVNLAIELAALTDNNMIDAELSGEQGIVLSFSHDGILPVTGQLRIYVGNIDNIKYGSRIHLYHYNKDSNKLETLPYSSTYKVDKDGYITINIVHCSDYIALTNKADASQITSLRDQITVNSLNKTLYIGGSQDNTEDIIVTLPSTLKIVEDLNVKDASKAIGGVALTFKSSNDKVATVDNNGKITAVGIGKAVITTRLVLYSGKVKTVKTRITVEEAYFTIENQISSIKHNDSHIFKIKAYGYKEDDIIWSTTKKSIVVINSKTGKAVAKSKGTDYVVARLGDEFKKFKLVVK